MKSKSKRIKILDAFIDSEYAWPGGYRMLALMDDGGVLCHSCTQKEYDNIEDSIKGGHRDGWGLQDVFVHWEGPPMYCDHCGKVLESEYGDPDSGPGQQNNLY